MSERIPYPLYSLPFSHSPSQILRSPLKFPSWRGNYMRSNSGWIGDGSLIVRVPTSLYPPGQKLLDRLSRRPRSLYSSFGQSAVDLICKSRLSPLPFASLPPVEIVQPFGSGPYAFPSIRFSQELAASGVYHNFICALHRPTSISVSFLECNGHPPVIFYFSRGRIVALLAALQLPLSMPAWEETSREGEPCFLPFA